MYLLYSLLPSVANEDAEGSTRPQAGFARKYQGTPLNDQIIHHSCCYQNVLHIAGALCGNMCNLHVSMKCYKV